MELENTAHASTILFNNIEFHSTTDARCYLQQQIKYNFIFMSALLVQNDLTFGHR